MSLPLMLSPEAYQQLVADVASKVKDMMASGDEVKSAYSVREVADRLQVSKDTINRRIKAGTIKTVSGVSPARISHFELQRLLGGADDTR